MINIIKRTLLAVIVLVFGVSTATAASNNSADVLKYIPADTPYVFATTEPLPTDLADKLEPTFDGVLRAYQGMLRHVMAEHLAKISSEEDSSKQAARYEGLMDEILGLMSLEGLRGVGIDRGSAIAFYGNGLLPVLRMELTDSDLFDAAIVRMEGKVGESLQVGNAKGESYKFVDADVMKIIVTTLNDQALITVVPSSFDEAQVATVLGARAPRDNLKKKKTLRAIDREYEFSSYMTGFIDVARIAGIFAGRGTEQDAEIFRAFGEELPAVSDVCAAEIMEVAGIAPRIVFGYSELTTDNISGLMVVELRDDIASGLATIPALVPGLGSGSGALMSFGFGMNPLALRDFFEARIDAMENDPYECEDFAEIQAGAAGGRQALNQPIPPMVYSFRGVTASIDDMDQLAALHEGPPESIDATVLVAMENAESLLMMAAMMDPQIAALNLQPDGKAVDLAGIAQIAALGQKAFAAMSENALSVSLGDGAEADAVAMLDKRAADPAPFMSMDMDAARYYGMIRDAMKSAPADVDGGEMPTAFRDAITEVLTLSSRLYDRMSVEVRFTARGVEIDSGMTLSD